jgi:hypothetical protein
MLSQISHKERSYLFSSLSSPQVVRYAVLKIIVINVAFLKGELAILLGAIKSNVLMKCY